MGAKLPLYANAAANTRLVGKQIGLLLQKLRELKGLSYEKVHCIGSPVCSNECERDVFIPTARTQPGRSYVWDGIE